MKVAKRQQDSRYKVSIPFSEDERNRFVTFLESTGRKAGPYLKIEMMNRVREWEAIQSGKTQLNTKPFEKVGE
ncbi:hypothetical protein [Sediminispirochaeta smaragdinae]|uniref:hypothetical protein n=1 Tax=Sediminispirochaeta smaragdinae TaxID=55206 RepID=UPI0005A42DE8|nr:hypothetical protein [Sediminispirochaeta smaragdinae]